MRKLWLFLLFSSLCFPQTQTPNIGLMLPPSGSTAWNVPLNYNFNRLDSIIGGVPIQGVTPAWAKAPGFTLGAPTETCTATIDGKTSYDYSVAPMVLYVCHNGSYTKAGNGGSGTGGGGTPGGANNQVQVNNAGAFGGFANFTFNSSTNILAVPTVLLSQDPITPLQASTKQYVDNAIAVPKMSVTGSNLDNTIVGWKPVCVLPACNPGGSNTPASTLQATVTTPTQEGTSMHQQLVTQATSTQTNALWVNNATPTCDSCTDWYPDFIFYIPSNGSNASSLEFDTASFNVSEQLDFMFGTQCNQTSHLWQIDNQFDPWINTSIPCNLTYNTWHHYQAHFYRIPGDTSCTYRTGPDGRYVLRDGTPISQAQARTLEPCNHYDYLTIDGVQNTINQTMRASPLPTGWGSASVIQFQIDIGATSSTTTVDEYIDKTGLVASGPKNYMPISGGAFTGPVTGSTWNSLVLTQNSTSNNTNLGGLLPAANTGTSNTAIGAGTLNNLTTGINNLATGVGSEYNVTTGQNNVGYGLNTIQFDLVGNGNTAIGVGAVNKTTSSSNTGVGQNALADDTTGQNNVGIGSGAGQNLTTPNATGSSNTFIGVGANDVADALNNTIVIGYQAQATLANQTVIGNSGTVQTVLHGDTQSTTFNNTKISNNVTTGNVNVGGGLSATLSGTNNTTVGYGTGVNLTTGTSDTAVGLNALTAVNAGSSDTAVGVGALAGLTTGSANVGIGNNALSQDTTGGQNIAIGYGAGINSTVPNPTGSQNTFVGTNANNSTDGLTNTIVLGYNAQAVQSNQIMIGNSAITQVCYAAGRFCWYSSSGPPPAALCTATNTGSLYSDTNGATSTTLYVCAGSGNWILKATVIAGGTAAMPTGTISGGGCSTVGSTIVTTTVGNILNVTANDSVKWSYSTAPVTANGILNVVPWVATGGVGFLYCNANSSPQSPPAETLNWQVTR